MTGGDGISCRRLRLLIACMLAGILNAAALQLATEANQRLTTVAGATNYELSCPVTGVVSQPSFVWSYSPARHLTPGTRLVESTKHSLVADRLVINQVGKTDTGFYTARVNDNSGRAVTCTIDLTVEYGPELVDTFPTTIVGNFSKSLTLTCPVRGVPTPHVIWRKNGRTLGPNANQRFSGLKLVFIAVTEAERGQYQCSASNAHGSVKSPVTIVNIQWPLKFVSIPPSVIDMREGQNTSVMCNVTGFPHARILWYMNDVQLTNDSHHIVQITYGERVSWSRMTFDVLNVTDNGMYKCEATNVNQQIVHNFELVVHAPPRITSVHPAERTAHVGMELEFKCTATGFPQPKFTWFRDGRAIPRIGNTHFIEGWDGALKIDRVIASDSGNYSCQAVNDAGYADSPLTSLVVFGIYFADKAPSVVPVLEGNSTELPCEVEGADFGIRIEWFKDGVKITSQCNPLEALSATNCKYVITNNTLQINGVGQGQLGTYKCKATELGKPNPEVISTETTVLFSEPVNIYPRLQDKYEGDQGRALTLDCKATGSPPPVVEWLYRGLHLLNDSHRMISGGKIKFRRLLVRDSGHYLCVASNNITEDRQDIRVHVNSVPGILNVNLVPKGNKMRLEWTMVGDGGYPITSFKFEYRMIAPNTGKWMRGKLSPKARVKTLSNLDGNSTYELKIWANNKLGQGTILRQVFATSTDLAAVKTTSFMGLSEKNLKLLYIGAGVAGGLFLLILIVVFAVVCRRKPDANAIKKRGEGIEDGQALVDDIQESPSHQNPAYGGADPPVGDLLELRDVGPSDSTDKNGRMVGLDGP